MSTLFVANVQSTVTSSVPAAPVVKGVGASTRRGRLPPPEATMLCVTGGGGVGVGDATGVGVFDPQPGSMDTVMMTARPGRRASPLSRSIRAPMHHLDRQTYTPLRTPE